MPLTFTTRGGAYVVEGLSGNFTTRAGAIAVDFPVATSSVIPFRRRRKGKKMIFEGKYAQAQTFPIELFEPLGIDFVTPAFAIGDVQISRNGTSFINTTNLPVITGDSIELTLTAAEKTSGRIKVRFVDQTGTKAWLDDSITITTYGHASAEHAFDKDLPLTGATIRAEMDSNSVELAKVQTLLAGFSSATVEPGQAAPSPTASRFAKIDELYKRNINKMDSNGSVERFYNSDDVTVDSQRTIGEAGSLTTKQKIVAGV